MSAVGRKLGCHQNLQPCCLLPSVFSVVFLLTDFHHYCCLPHRWRFLEFKSCFCSIVRVGISSLLTPPTTALSFCTPAFLFLTFRLAYQAPWNWSAYGTDLLDRNWEADSHNNKCLVSDLSFNPAVERSHCWPILNNVTLCSLSDVTVHLIQLCVLSDTLLMSCDGVWRRMNKSRCHSKERFYASFHA